MPPHLRKNPQQGRATRSTPQGIPGSGRSSVSSVTSPQPSPTQHVAPVELDSNLNGGECHTMLGITRIEILQDIINSGGSKISCRKRHQPHGQVR